MSVSPRKKKLVKILIILGPRLALAYDNDEEGTIWETIGIQMAQCQPIAMLISLDTRQEDVMLAMESLETILSNESNYVSEQAWLADAETASGVLQTALDSL